MRRWSSLLRRPRTEPGTPQAVRWRYLNASELSGHRGVTTDLLARAFDGMTVRGVFTADEAARAVAEFPRFLEHATPVVFGSTLGRPLLQGGMSNDRTEHLEDAERFRLFNLEMFGFDPHERLAQVLAPTMEPLMLSAPLEDGRRYNPGVIRVMEPGAGGLAAHAGNQFLASNAEGSASHLLQTTRAFDHLSYFVMLQPPEDGGELIVYEHLWEDPRTQGSDVDEPLGDDAAFDDMPGLRLTPGPGDLIIFGAGRRWHRVEKVRGSIPRVTYGGFAAPSRVGLELQCWS